MFRKLRIAEMNGPLQRVVVPTSNNLWVVEMIGGLVKARALTTSGRNTN
ncbi:MAG: hypothetical protein P4L49_07035 [Desulfosporosinus sp.]|nr:hypothetical protein [Desulfosporosinus sp.]